MVMVSSGTVGQEILPPLPATEELVFIDEPEGMDIVFAYDDEQPKVTPSIWPKLALAGFGLFILYRILRRK